MFTAQEQQKLREIDAVIARGPYQDSWDSLQNYRPPRWFCDAKFGIFIHWGAYAVPAFENEWYPRNMYIQGSPAYEHHVKTWGPHRDFGYKDFIPRFRAENFDPAAWTDLFVQAGARYVVPVAEHHDGFQMYKSELSHWNAAEMGPRRDVLGELCAAFARRGLVGGASSHRVEHWFFMGHGKAFDSDIREPLRRGDLYWPAMPEPADIQDLDGQPAPGTEYLQDWLLRTCEIVDRYRPRLLYFDWWVQHRAVRPWLRKFAAYYYNRAAEWGQEAVICYKHDAFPFGAAVVDIERGQFAGVQPFHWQTDEAVALNSWCYTPGNRYRPAAEILQDLVDIVSKNGNLLLNIGPKADGTIPEQDAAILREMGAWLRQNGEAIYGSGVWRLYGEGPTQITEGEFADAIKKNFTAADVRYTVGHGNIYAIALRGAADGVYTFPALGARGETHKPLYDGIVTAVEALAAPDAVQSWQRTPQGLVVRTRGLGGDAPVAFRVRQL